MSNPAKFMSTHSNTDDTPPDANSITEFSTAMKGEGFYNENSSFQKKMQERVIEAIAKAATSIPIPNNRPLNIADLGCSQGRNSMDPMRTIINTIRARDNQIPISILHNDLPSNDFTSLFSEVGASKDSYLEGQDNVFYTGLGRSYYQQLVPSSSLDVVVALVTLHWMPSIPNLGSEAWNAHHPKLSDEQKQELDAVQQDFLNQFLMARAEECASGSKLVLTMVSRDERKDAFWGLLEAQDVAFQRLLSEGVITKDHINKLNLTFYMRTIDQVQKLLDTSEIQEKFVVDELIEDFVLNPSQLLQDENQRVDANIQSMAAVVEPAMLQPFEGEALRAAVVDELWGECRKAMLEDKDIHFSGNQIKIVLTRK